MLIVDDDQVNLLVARSYLKSIEDYKIYFDTSNNGQEALDLIKKNKEKGLFYDIILMDCNMPVMDGFQATEKIKSLERKKEIPYTPVVAITANVGTADRKKCEKSGMDFFLAKPYQKDQLINIMRSAFRSKNEKIVGNLI